MDLTQIPTAQLKEILAKLPKEIERRQKEEKAQLRKELEAKAAALGYSLDELLGETKTQVRAPVAAKYRHPQDTSLNWSGRGRQPRWVVEFVAAGGTLEQLAV